MESLDESRGFLFYKTFKKLRKMETSWLGRELTKEEELYRRLLFANLHYDGDAPKALQRCSELLSEVRQSNLGEDFKYKFEGLFKDQASKLYETHFNWGHGLKTRFDALFETA